MVVHKDHRPIQNPNWQLLQSHVNTKVVHLTSGLEENRHEAQMGALTWNTSMPKGDMHVSRVMMSHSVWP